MSQVFEVCNDFNGFVIEARHLFKQNNEELNFFDLPVDLSMNLYETLNSMGALRVYLVREEGKLVGYSSFFLQPHMQHKDQIQAKQDVLYIRPESRGNGLRFIKWCDAQLQQDNVSFVFRSVTTFNNWSLLLKRLHYKECETIYMNDLRE